jgi:hypothetical protein
LASQFGQNAFGWNGPIRLLQARSLSIIDGYNNRCQPFAWTKSADQILAKADRKILQTRNTIG